MRDTVLIVFAFVFLVIAAFWNPGCQPNTPWYRNIHVGWLGLACWVATLIFK